MAQDYSNLFAAVDEWQRREDAKPKRNALAAGLSAGVDELQGLGYSALGALADATKFEGIRDWANDRAAMNQEEARLNGRPDLERIEDQSASTILPYLGYQLTKQVPIIGGSIAAGMVAPEAVVPAWLARAAAALPRAVGGGGGFAAGEFAANRAALEAGKDLAKGVIGATPYGAALGAGSMYQESVEAGDPSPYKALALSPVYGALEALAPAAAKGLLTRGGNFSGNLATRMAKAGGVGAAGGSATELLQGEMEMGFNPNLTDEEKFSRRLNSAVVGGLLEGGMGSLGGIRRGLSDKTKETDLLGTGNTDPNAPLEYEQVPITPPTGPTRPGYLDMPGMDFESIPPAGPFEGPMRPGYLDNPGIDFESLSVPMARIGEVGALRPGLGLPTQDLVNLNTGVARTPTGNTLDTMTAAINEPSGFYGNDPNQIESPINMGDLYEAKLGLEPLPPEQPPLRAVARDAFVKAGGTPKAWGTWVSKNKLTDTDDVAFAEALYSRANDKKVSKPEPWIAAHQVFAPPEQTQQGAQTNAVQVPSTAGVDVRQQAGNGQGVAVGNAQGQDAPQTGQGVVIQQNGQPTQGRAVATSKPAALVPTKAGQVALAPEQRAVVQKQLLAGLSKRDQEVASAWMDSGFSFEAAAARLGQAKKGKPLSRQAVQQAIFGQRKDGKLVLKENGKPKQVGIVDKLRARAEQMGLSPEQIGSILTPNQTLAHDADRVGLAPDAQASVLEQEAYLKSTGEESTGDNRSAGIVDTVGGSQTETSANAGNPLATEWLKQNAPEDFAREAWDENRQEGDPYWKDLTPDLQAEALGAARRGEPLAQTIEKVSAQARQTVIPREQAERVEAAAEGKVDPAYAVAGAEWEDARGGDANTPAFDALSDTQQYKWAQMLAEGVPVGRAMKKVLADNSKFGTEGGSKPVIAKNPYTADELSEDIKKYVRADIPGRKLIVVNSVEDLLNHPDNKVKAVGVQIELKGAYGVASDGRAFLIANRIEKGRGRAKFMHEVGAHLGLENLLPKVLYDRLVGQIKKWRDSDADTDEVTLANRAMNRVIEANTPHEDIDAELLAYFIEEAVQAGIDPTADVIRGASPLMQWFRTLWAAFKVAVRKLGINPDKLNVEDVVNLAFGAARLEMSGTWHGTAAAFRKFNHKFMGSGEGAQAYGWGTYLAQRAGIGKGYWKQDVARKTEYGRVLQVIPNNGKPFSKEEKRALDLISRNGVYAKTWRDDLQRVLDGAEKRLTKTQESLADVRAGLRSGRSPAWRYEADIQEDQKLIDAAKSLLSDGRATWVEQSQDVVPDGSLMRVDTAVAEDELLDWDKPLSEQSEKLREALRGKVERGVSTDRYSPASFDNEVARLTGKQLYERLSSFFGKYDPQKREKVDDPKKASLYLESIGVKGIKFLDARSRNQPLKDIKKAFLDSLPEDAESEDVMNLIGTGKFTPKQEAVLKALDADEWLGFDYPAQAISTALSSRFLGFDPSDTLIDAVEALRNPDSDTRNLVIFNEKNTFRVGSEVRADRQKMRFGVESSATGATRPYPEELQYTPKLVAQINLDSVKHWAKRGLNAVVFGQDLVDIAVKQGLKSAKGFFDLQNSKVARRVRHEAEVDRIVSEGWNLPDRKALNRFVNRATRQQKWGYQPEWLGEDVEVDSTLAAEYKALSPKAREVVDAVFKYGTETYKELQTLVTRAIDQEYQTKLTGATTDEQREQINKDWTAKKKFAGTKLPKLTGPYAPLKRFGDHVMVAKSQAYLDAEKAGDAKEMEKLVEDGGHYVVEFFESSGEAKARATQLKDYFPHTDSFIKQKAYDSFKEVPWASVLKIKSAAAELPEDSKAAQALQDVIMDVYLSMLAESSARKSQLRRKGVEGENTDMLRAFASQGRATAHFIAALDKTDAINQQITAMKQESAGGDVGTRDDRNAVFNEILARYAQSLDYRPTPVADKLMRVNSLWTLVTSPGYFLQNMTQPFMLTLPVLASRYGNGASWGEVTKAYKDVTGFIKQMNHTLDIDKLPLTDDERKMLAHLRDTGRIDITIAQDLGDKINPGRFDDTAFGAVMRKVWAVPAKVEMVNRVVSALAAYRLAQGKHKNPTEYASEVIDRTHGNYAASNAPRVFNSSGAAKLILQFRKFQLIQASLLARLVHDSFKNADPKEKAIARKALTFILAHHAVMAGAMGLPAANLVGMVLSAIAGDDDEPKDAERMLREWIGDEDVANLLLKGIPAALGVDVSGKVGMGNVFALLPFGDIDLLSRKGVESTVVDSLGSAVSLAARVGEGIGQMVKGEYYKGLETAMPKGIKDAMTAYRIATEGVTKKNNDVVIRPDEIHLGDVMFQALGLPTTKLTERQRREGDVIEMEKYYRERTGDMKRAYAKAYRNGDGERLTELREEWGEVRAAMQRNGLKPQPLSSLLKAPQEQTKRERETTGGVQFNKYNRRFVEEGATR